MIAIALSLALEANPGDAAGKPEADMNPLLAPWTGPFGGVPPFERIRVEHFRPALEGAMAAELAAVDQIAANPAPPTFENTVAALERAGRSFERTNVLFSVWATTLSTAEFRAVETEMAPRLAAFQDRITQNERLFQRIAAVYQARETSGLSPEQKRVAWLHYTTFVRAGARLDADAKKRVAAMNERLAALYTAFNQHVLSEEGEELTLLEGEADLAGLSPSLRATFAAVADSRGQKGRFAVPNTRSAVDPFLANSARRDLREKVWRLFVTRGDHGDARDNNAVVREILQIRAARAQALGFPTHAHWRLEDSMAKTPERALALLEAVWPAAVARVREEVADMQAVADREGAGIAIEPWDYLYYAEKVRKERYEIDAAQVKPYLELERLREGMFFVAGELFDLHFAPAPGLPVCHPDVRAFEVRDGGGHLVGLWYFDPYARPGKRSGAWMNTYRPEERLDGQVPAIVSNNANFVKGAAGEPVLLTWDDAETLFHEFGHALHALCSATTYPSVAGTAVARDYVEFPSQLLERWLATPEVLHRFALHSATGRPMPDALLAKILRASKFNQGYSTLEYLASALVDMKAHLAGARAIDPAAFEKETLAALGMPKEMAMRHRLPHFQHLFSGDSYSAAYYSYLWADAISADAYEAFTEAGGPYDKAVAARLKRYVFSVGNAVDPAEGYRSFRGRDPGIGALMRKRGFPEPSAKPAPAP